MYEQADRLVSKTQFPEGTAQNNQLARWYYYLGESDLIARLLWKAKSEESGNASARYNRADHLPRTIAGRIRAIQLDYTVAHASLLQAIRRGPSDFAAAPGFFQHAHKLLVLVSLLMGEIPERKVFREPVLRKALRPYLEIAQGGSTTPFLPSCLLAGTFVLRRLTAIP